MIVCLLTRIGMEYAVRYQHEQYAGKLRPGDHICTNHPLAGGTHLPDITIITPVWDAERKQIIFYVASRGHHGKFDIYSHDEGHLLTSSSRNWRYPARLYAF